MRPNETHKTRNAIGLNGHFSIQGNKSCHAGVFNSSIITIYMTLRYFLFVWKPLL
jgi:hypothetical protein